MRGSATPTVVGGGGGSEATEHIPLSRREPIGEGEGQQARAEMQRGMERCPSWPKGHDWKSCVPTKIGTEGSNPSLSARNYLKQVKSSESLGLDTL